VTQYSLRVICFLSHDSPDAFLLLLFLPPLSFTFVPIVFPTLIGAAEEEWQLEQHNVAQQNGNAAAEYVRPSALLWLPFLLRPALSPL
jgi:hypothetical protein